MNNKGQFSIIAALLVAVILIATVITTYSIIRDSQLQDQPQIMSAIDETNLAIKDVLGYTVGYYGSVLQVTGDSSYANRLATDYLRNGLGNITFTHPDWAASFNLTQDNIGVYWYTNSSYCAGNLTVNYDLVGLGINGVEYNAACRLQVDIENYTSNSEIELTVVKDEGEPYINLGTQNFKFYNYTYSNSTWSFVNPTNIQASFANGTYIIDAPSGINPKFCVVQVQDPRGLIVTASSYSHYVCTFNWNSTLYSTLVSGTTNGAVAVELLQNGTMRWLGQSITTQPMPIPPVPVKSIHVNETINNVDQEVPYQVEDWESDYRVPLGLTNNASLFGRNNMIVFLVNNNAKYNVSKVTVWWDGNDTAIQTPLAIYNPATSPFRNCVLRNLSNGILNLTISASYAVFTANSYLAGSNVNASASFFRINGLNTSNGAAESYPILNGIVRDIVQQEGEWGNNGVVPDMYSQIIVTLPANATYYTYQLRLMFMSTTQKRNITDLCPLQLAAINSSAVTALTENGTDTNGYPIVSVTSLTDLFCNYTSTSFTPHHWSQFNSSSPSGTGIMFTDNANQQLYYFDSIANKSTGALRVNATSHPTIELLPVSTTPANFTTPLDITWQGAIVTYNPTTPPIYSQGSGTKTGLWILVEYPPSVNVTAQN